MKSELRDSAIALRRRGLSYSEILEEIPVAKSTLSLWLRSVGLSKRHKQRLTGKKLAAMQRGWLKVHQQRIERINEIKSQSKGEVVGFINDPFWLLGTLLYWTEGAKEKEWEKSAQIKFANMDLEMHKLFREWLKKYFNVSEEDLRYELYIHEKANISAAKVFWTKNLAIPANQDLKVYLKRHNPKTVRKNTQGNYNGLLRICVRRSAELNRKIAGWIEGVVEYFSKHIGR